MDHSANFVAQGHDRAVIPKLLELQGKDELNPVFNNYILLEGFYPPEITHVSNCFQVHARRSPPIPKQFCKFVQG